MSKPFNGEALNILEERLEEEKEKEERHVSWRTGSEAKQVIFSDDIDRRIKIAILQDLGYRYIEENREEERTEEEIVEKRRWVIYKKCELVENLHICGSKSLFEKIHDGDDE